MTPKEKRKKDREFSKFILERDNHTCQRCGRPFGKMDTSHCIPRENLSLRYEPLNALCLCFRCHKRFWHHSPLEAAKWLRSYYGDTHCDNLILSASL